MSVNLDGWVLPAEASRVDRITLSLWQFWEGWLRGALALGRRVAFGVVVLATAAWFVFDGAAFGILGVVVSGAIVIGITGGVRAAGTRDRYRRRGSVGRTLLAVVVGVPLGLFFITFGAVLVMSFVVVPVVNYPFLVVVVVPGAIGVGYIVQRFRKRNDARYPPAVNG